MKETCINHDLHLRQLSRNPLQIMIPSDVVIEKTYTNQYLTSEQLRGNPMPTIFYPPHAITKKSEINHYLSLCNYRGILYKAISTSSASIQESFAIHDLPPRQLPGNPIQILSYVPPIQL